jgi:hypothetical protein
MPKSKKVKETNPNPKEFYISVENTKNPTAPAVQWFSHCELDASGANVGQTAIDPRMYNGKKPLPPIYILSFKKEAPAKALAEFLNAIGGTDGDVFTVVHTKAFLPTTEQLEAYTRLRAGEVLRDNLVETEAVVE